MPRLRSSRLSEHRLSEVHVIMRVAESYSSPVQTTSTRENSVSRMSMSFIPVEFDFETGRLGDGRLGAYHLGGGIVRGIATTSSCNSGF